ncbi:FAD-dependent monooxygenase (plasmid) [Streptomyces sp. NBC_00390]|uniref:FAD-dependent oxidoreductase n=1 Tax=Streptomyces sp. NBC_00390 TaxID=2975736 RepID=UPI002E222C84
MSQKDISRKDPDVLIVGGGTAGLFVALFLAQAGIRTLLVERHRAPLAHPRAMEIGPRTVELLRTAGLADAVDAECIDMTGGKLQTLSASVLSEADLAGFSRRVPPRADAFRDLTSQTLRGICPQDRLDRVVAEAAQAAGAQLAFATELMSFAQDDEGVIARLGGVDGTYGYEVRVRYLVAADGARSSTREALGIGNSGPGALGDPLISVLFQADFTDPTRALPFIVRDSTTPNASSGLQPVDGEGKWIYRFHYAPSAGQTAEHFTPERCADQIRAAVAPGSKLPLRIVSVLPWQVQGLVADRFRSGRVFLAGDAAHVFPPVGTFGIDTGVSDAYNLAWKLAHVLQGKAGEGLLDSYDDERRPTAELLLKQLVLRLEDPALPR